MSTIKVLLLRPGEHPCVEDVDASEWGLAQVINRANTKRLWPFSHPHVCMVIPSQQRNHCIAGLAPNRFLWGSHRLLKDTVFGNAAIVGFTREGEYVGLDEEQTAYFASKFRDPDYFPDYLSPREPMFDRDLTVRVVEDVALPDLSGVHLEYHHDTDSFVGYTDGISTPGKRAALRDLISRLYVYGGFPDYYSAVTYTHDNNTRAVLSRAVYESEGWIDSVISRRFPRDTITAARRNFSTFVWGDITPADPQ